MASKYTYSRVIYNEYLGKSKELKASYKGDLERKVAEQYEIWNRQVKIKQEKEKVEDLKKQAEELDLEAQSEILEYNSILKNALHSTTNFKWDNYFRKDEFEAFYSTKCEPNLALIKQQLSIPQKSIWEQLFDSKRIKREKLEAEANQLYKNQFEQYERDKEQEYKKWENEKELFETEKFQHNNDVSNWKKEFESNSTDAIESYFGEVFDASEYPDSFPKVYSVKYDPSSKILIVSVNLPNTDDITKVKGYKYVVSTKSIKQVELKEKDFSLLYDEIIKQVALRTVYEVFTEDYTNNIQSVVFNGWINSINKANGQEYNACIISLQVSKEKFVQIDFNKISINDCVKDLKGVYAGNLTQLAPVKPIMELNRDDTRFVASKDIIDSMNSGDNLATMNWEDFEHLVRELFSKYFADNGSEVKVTQSSRDGGVDAIAFDPDPIRGGKFVIQAKRYNRVVPVSAVRDLYGTMINEGAAKGILVTTSYYGNDSREFVKDKPISLIDGANLIHMFDQYGYDAYIELQNKIN